MSNAFKPLELQTDKGTRGGNPSRSKTKIDLHQLPVSVFYQLPSLGSSAEATSSTDLAPPSLFDQGVIEGESRAAKIYQEKIQTLETMLSALNQTHGDIRGQIEHSHLAVVEYCIRQIFPKLALESACRQIIEFIRSLASAAFEGDVQIAVHPDRIDTVDAILCDFVGELEWVSLAPDPQMNGAAMRARWDGGGVSIDPQKTAKECLAMIRHVLSQHSDTKDSQ